MLTEVLVPLIKSNQPQSCRGLSPALLADWYNTVLRLKNEIGQWVNKHTKHTNVSGVCRVQELAVCRCVWGVSCNLLAGPQRGTAAAREAWLLQAVHTCGHSTYAESIHDLP